MIKFFISALAATILFGCQKPSVNDNVLPDATLSSGSLNRTISPSILQWQKCLGSSADDYSFSVARASDGSGYFIAGYTSAVANTIDGNVSGTHGERDAWVVKIGLDGTTVLWQIAVGGSARDEAQAVVATPDGGCLIAGDTFSNDGDITGNHGAGDVLIAKISSTGKLEWTKTFGGSKVENAYALIATIDGGYAFSGIAASTDGDLQNTNIISQWDIWLVKFNIPPAGTTGTASIAWQKTFAAPGSDSQFGYSLAQAQDGSFAITGDASTTYIQFWVISTDASGNFRWDKKYGSIGTNVGFGVTATGNNGFLVTGRLNGDIMVCKLDNAGTQVWQTILSGGSGSIFGRSVVSTTQGDIIVGVTNSKNGNIIATNGGDDLFALRLDDATGNKISSNVFGGKGNEYGRSIIANTDGTYVATASTNSNNGDVSGNHGLNDYWVVKFKF